MFAETGRHVRLSDPITTIFHANVTTAAVSSDQETSHRHDHQRGTSMHLKCPSCRGIPRKDHPVGRSLLVGIVVVLVAVSSALAWNKAGHMVSGAIAYADLKQTIRRPSRAWSHCSRPTRILGQNGRHDLRSYTSPLRSKISISSC